jgi:V8-like Glu-specific endopeptidase
MMMMMIIITIIITTTTTTNSIQFYSILFHSTHVYYSAESRAGWPITNIAHHKSINNKGKKKHNTQDTFTYKINERSHSDGKYNAQVNPWLIIGTLMVSPIKPVRTSEVLQIL